MRGPAKVTVSTIVILIHFAVPLSPQVRPERAAPGAVLARGLVSGQILDAATGSELAGAQVTLRALPEGVVGLLRMHDSAGSGSMLPRLTRNTVTSDDGVYRFAGLPDGRFELHVRRLGYRPATVAVDLRAGAGLNMSLGLAVVPIRLEPIEATVASSSPDIQRVRHQLFRSDSARTTAVRRRQLTFLEPDVRALTTADMLESVILGDPDLFRALKGLAGVHGPTMGTAEFWVRGAPFEHASVRWDGLPLYNAFTGRGEAAAVTTDAIGGAFLYLGSRPANIAGGGAGVLDLRTRRASGQGDIRGVAESTGMWGRLSVEQRAADGRFGWLVGGRRQLTTRNGVTDLTARFDLALDEERSIDISGMSLWEYYNKPPFCCEPFNYATWRNRAGRLAFTTPAGGYRSTHFAGGSQFVSLAEIDPIDPRFAGPFEVISQPRTDVGLRYLTFGSHFTQIRRAGAGYSWQFGYEIVDQAVRYDGPIATVSNLTSSTRGLSSNRSLQYATVWGDKRFSLHERVDVEIGLRADVGPAPRDQGVVRLGPRLALRFPLTPDMSISASAGRDYRYAHGVGETGALLGTTSSGRRRLTRVWMLAGDDLPAARTDIVSLGAEAWVEGSWLASFSAFARRSSGVAVTDPRSGDQRPFVLGRDRAHGLEVTVRRLAGRWTTSLGYSYAVARREADGFDYPGPADVRHAFDANVTWRLSRPLRLGGSFVAATGAPFTRVQVCDETVSSCPADWNAIGSPNALRLPSDEQFNLFGEWTKRNADWDLSVFVRWNDVFGDNRDYYYFGTVPGCAERFAIPCMGQSSTDRVVTINSGRRRIDVGARIAF